MTDFVLYSAKAAAERAIERHGMLMLTARRNGGLCGCHSESSGTWAGSAQGRP